MGGEEGAADRVGGEKFQLLWKGKKGIGFGGTDEAGAQELFGLLHNYSLTDGREDTWEWNGAAGTGFSIKNAYEELEKQRRLKFGDVLHRSNLRLWDGGYCTIDCRPSIIFVNVWLCRQRLGAAVAVQRRRKHATISSSTAQQFRDFGTQ